MSTANELLDAVLRYLQSAGDSLRELARRADIPPEQLATAPQELSPLQIAQLWQLVQARLGASAAFTHKVRSLIHQRLESGRARVTVIAAELNMSRQTLYKRLKLENQTFAALLDQVRRESAMVYLGNPEHSLTDVAQRLGFSELSAFSRAFKRWVGQSPAHYRAGRPSFS